jgi:Reverse transcriptase (RNA-dependent DNA polymerase)
VKHSHTFGCPVYVLDGKLQTGKRIPKWDDRSRIGLFLGWSPRHSRKVALVLNLATRHVSPQFHVVFDDLFETLGPSAGNRPPKSAWQVKAGLILDPASESKPKQQLNPPSDQVENLGSTGRAEVGRDSFVPGELQVEQELDDESFEQGEQPVLPELGDDQPASLSEPSGATSSQTRSGRTVRPTTRWLESVEQQRQGIVALLTVPWEVFHDASYRIQEEMENPMAFVASTNPDIMYFDEAMQQPDRAQVQEARIKEVQTHTENGHWTIISRDEVPSGDPVLPSVWAMRRKRRIATQEVYKWKARLNLHRGKQEYGLNYWETYSPVVTWATVRLILVLVLLNKWATRQVDFVLAYPQADIKVPLYMEIPCGFTSEGSRKKNCLLLEKNIYGQRQAGRVGINISMTVWKPAASDSARSTCASTIEGAWPCSFMLMMAFLWGLSSKTSTRPTNHCRRQSSRERGRFFTALLS